MICASLIILMVKVSLCAGHEVGLTNVTSGQVYILKLPQFTISRYESDFTRKYVRTYV